MKYELYTLVKLKDGRNAAIVDYLGLYYIVDVGKDETDWDNIMVKENDIICLLEKNEI